MDRLGAGGARGLDERGDVEVALASRCRPDAHRLVGLAHVARGGIRIGVDRHGADVHAPRGAEDAAGDLAAVGDQEALDHARAYMRKTPKGCASYGALRVTASASDNTRRVSRGSMTPSSHRRAEE